MDAIRTLDALRTYLKVHSGTLDRAIVQGIDFRRDSSVLKDVSSEGTLFVDCLFTADAVGRLAARGAAIFPKLGDLPYDLFRAELYVTDELFAGYDASAPKPNETTWDHRVYEHFQATGGSSPADYREALARRIHDVSIDVALSAYMAPSAVVRPAVAVMGGHSTKRDSASYLDTAVLSYRIARAGFLVISGGGPGAMEAINLGASFADHPEGERALKSAIDRLKTAASYTDRLWLAVAFEVINTWFKEARVQQRASLGVPTWHYGHEPPNAFATQIAKYFANSIREDGLVTLGNCGIVFTPGSAGTIQEIFQDLAQNYYAIDSDVRPMIFLDDAYWKWNKPVFPLATSLTAGRACAAWIAALASTGPDEIVSFLNAYREQHSHLLDISGRLGMRRRPSE